jgi:hypothetical protein
MASTPINLRMFEERKITWMFARAGLFAAAMFLGSGCVSTQVIDQTLPPYASRSDEGAEPANAPKPMVVPEYSENPAAIQSEGGGVTQTQHAIGDAVLSPFRALGKLLN